MSEPQSAFRANTRETREFTVDAIGSGLVPFIKSSPGMGKSSIVKDIAKEYNLKVIDVRLSTCTPEDLTGLPEFYTDENGRRKARFAPFDLFPLEGDKLPINPDGIPYDGWLIFFDEFNSSSKAVQAASYKVMLDRMIDQHRLHERVMMVCAGNLATDRAIVNPLSTAMQSRLVHIEMYLVFEHWLEDVAFKQEYDNRIISYLSYNRGQLYDFRPDHNDATFCCPRTWEFMNKLIKGKEFDLTQNGDGSWIYEMDRKAPLYAGTITSGVSTSFIQFTRVSKNLPTKDEILADPENAPIPAEPGARYATLLHLLDYLDKDNFNGVSDYIKRLSMEFRVVFFRGVRIRKPELRSHPVFAKALVDLSKHLND